MQIQLLRMPDATCRGTCRAHNGSRSLSMQGKETHQVRLDLALSTMIKRAVGVLLIADMLDYMTFKDPSNSHNSMILRTWQISPAPYQPPAPPTNLIFLPLLLLPLQGLSHLTPLSHRRSIQRWVNRIKVTFSISL